jgi:hypothetical protein
MLPNMKLLGFRIRLQKRPACLVYKWERWPFSELPSMSGRQVRPSLIYIWPGAPSASRTEPTSLLLLQHKVLQLEKAFIDDA